MSKPDILKLAPTLSVKERIKFIISNWHKSIVDGPILTEVERKAILDIKTYEEWCECQYFISLYQWSNLLLRDEIEKIAIRLAAIGFQLVHFRLFLILDSIIKSETVDLDTSLLNRFEVVESSYDPNTNIESIALKENSLLRPGLKELAISYNEQLQDLSNHREAVRRIEAALDCTVLFDKRTQGRFQGYYDLADKLISEHNSFIESLEVSDPPLTKCLIDKEQYLTKIPEPDPISVEEFISEIKGLADTESSIWHR